jgi:HEPN domain-containing protein
VDETVVHLVKLWQVKAENDLKTIENEFGAETPVTDTICFHAQQAAEKYLKSYLVSKQVPFRNTHSITEILRSCIEIDTEFEELSFAVFLTAYAVDLRYPDDFYIPDISEAREAFRIAKEVKSFVEKKIQYVLHR